MSRVRPALLASLLFCAPAFATPPSPREAPRTLPAYDESAPRVQIALLLDTSGSMDGLIHQAREQLWKVVNAFSRAQREGQRPALELALYEYGNDNLSAEGGYVRQVLPFTRDLDRVSEALFALTTNGGSEFCGQVIQKATQQLAWSRRKGDLKLLYIAGNEPFTQGPVSWGAAVGSAREHGIRVNTLHCGDAGEGARTGWREAAVAGGGRYLAFDHTQAVVHVPAPQDAEIARLGEALNRTYVGYGAQAPAAAARQSKQDANAVAASPAAAAERAVSKASAAYDNSAWDLVDRKRKGESVAAMPAAQLPAELRALPEPEREAYVEKKSKEREALQARIAKLGAERQAFLAAEEKKRAQSGAATLDSALLQSAKAAAAEEGYAF